MIRAQITLAVVGLFLLPMQPAHAESQYWLSVASYRNQSVAEEAAARAREVVPELLRVLEVVTDQGFIYRVAAGPFANLDSAKTSRAAAQRAGYADAWIWVDSDSALDPLLSFDDSPTDFDPEFSFDSELELDIYEYESDLDAPEYESNLDFSEYREQQEPDSDQEQESDVLQGIRPTPELIDQPPPGYQLNKLRRDAQLSEQPGQPPFAQLELGQLDLNEEWVYEELEELVTEVEHQALPPQVLLNQALGDPIPLGKFSEGELAVRVDGKLDEPQWQSTTGVDSFVVTDPDTLARPRYQTIVKMFYSERGLYVGFTMQQPADTLVQRYSGRDEGGLNRDGVGVTLDTSGEGRYGYWMNLALGGNQTDGTVLPEREFSSAWDGAWEGATTVTKYGWDAEIFLPWSQVAMPSEAGKRTINAYVSRKVAALDERWTIPALPNTQPLFISALQPLTLEQVNPRKQWSVFPYGSITQDAVDDTTEIKVGADFFYRPSTDFQVTAALNPDFGNVESDDVIINLSAFETFFPEKRLFFKEGIEIFDTSPRGSTRLLHTRRIGASPRPPDVPEGMLIPGDQLGQPAGLLGATKAVGAIGSVRYGVLTAMEDETKFDVGELNFHQDGSDYGVARFLYEDKGADGSYRAIGSISTVATHPEQDAFVQGIDYHYLTARGAVKVDGQMLYSSKDDVGDGSGGFVDVTYQPNSSMRYRLAASHYDDKLNINDLGFLRRNNVSQLGLNTEYRVSSPTWAPWARKASLRGTADLEVNGDGDKTNKSVGTRLSLDFNNRSDIRLSLTYNPERVDDRNSRGNGTYVKQSAHSTSFNFRSDSSKSFYYEVGLRHAGEEAGGHRMRGQFGVTWRPVEHFNIGAFAQYQVRDGWLLWQGDQNFTSFESREWRPNLNLNYFLGAKQQLRLSAQWVGIRAEEDDFFTIPPDNGKLIEGDKPLGTSDDFAVSSVALQLRYRWELAPLSELFVVYTLNGDHRTVDDSFSGLFTDAYGDPSNEQLVVKLRYRLGS